MALTESKMLPLGTKAPEFSLPNVVNGNTESLDQLKGENGSVIVFMCNHCPYVVYLIDHFVSFAKEYQKKGINTIAISSNDIENYPADNPKLMRELALEKDFSFLIYMMKISRLPNPMMPHAHPTFLFWMQKTVWFIEEDMIDRAQEILFQQTEKT